MPLMTWSSKNSIGVEIIDHQHDAIMKILNELHAASMKGKAHEVADPLMPRLASLLSEHFSTEERLMESISFPELAGHCARHREMTARIAELLLHHQNGDLPMYVPLLHFLRDYIKKHMQTEDQEYAAWLQSHRSH